MNIKQVCRTLLLWTFLAVFPISAYAAGESSFKDFAIDLSVQGLLTADEYVEQAVINPFGIVVAEDGSLSRVAADDASANAVISGKYWNSHGWVNVKLVLPVNGPVKIGVGNCTYSNSTCSIKNADGQEVGSFPVETKGCWSSNKSDDLVTYGYYKGEAGVITIDIPSYTPYVSITAVEDVPSSVVVSYDLGESAAAGSLPASVTVDFGSKVTIPANFSLYVEGKTLTAWTDGTNQYAVGSEFTPEANVTLTPVFTENTVTLADRKEAVSIRWDFQQRNGAPVIAYQNQLGFWVAQAEVNGKTIDVKADFDTNNGGKIANGNWSDWAQMNAGTKFTIPSCKGAVVSMEAYNTITTTTIDGQSDYAQANTISLEIINKAATIDVVIGDGSYYRYIQTILPVVEAEVTGQTYSNEKAAVIWDFNTTTAYDQVSSVTPQGAFSVTSVNIGDIEVTGSGTGQAKDENGSAVTFVKLRPSGTTTSVEWFVKPAKGLTFTPVKLSAYIQRFGTDAENGVSVMAKLADGTEVNLGSFTAPRNNRAQADDKFGANENYTNRFEIELTAEQQAQLTSGDGFSMFAAVGVSSSKEGGFSDVRIEGLLNGTVANVAKYTLETMATPAEAGSVSVYPVSDVYDEGSELKLTATENFGYDFVNWTDAEGNVLSEEHQFMYTINADSKLSANFKKVNTYALNLTVEAPANDYMVQWNPAPTEVDGKKMYEEGTKVTLTTANNRILTFAGWSNDETAGEIVVEMTKDIDLTARYSAIDFIAGWDFYRSGKDGRKADFFSADNDAAQLVLRDEEGNTIGWLDKSQEAAGGYEGKPAAVNWNNSAELGTYYYQVKVNAEAFTDIKVSAEMLYNYNAYQKQDVAYSIDGETWTVVGSIEIPGVKNWTLGEFALPAEANNQKDLYIRWKADKTSAIDGSSSNNDGTSITNIFVMGTMKLVDDGKAPVLVSTIPAQGSNSASANGKIVLNFDEKVKVAEGTMATLGDVQLQPVVSGKSVMFEYKSLDYATEYTFTLPANSISDLTDNKIAEAISLSFTTKTKPVVTKALFDFIVPDDGTFEEAIAAASKRSDNSKRFYIFVKEGDYLLAGDEGATVEGSDGKTYKKPTTSINTPNISIIGESREATILRNEAVAEIEGLHKCQTIDFGANVKNAYMQDINLRNGMPYLGGRAAALQDRGDKNIFKNVTLFGGQDTYLSNNDKGRFYFEGGTLEGYTDYLCGKGDVYYNAVELIIRRKGSVIAAPSQARKYGYVFVDCSIQAEKPEYDDGYCLGRPWGQGTPRAIFINTKMIAQPSAAGWTEMSGGYPARFAEYNSMTASGTVIDLSGRKTTFADTHTNNPVLSAEEAAEYTLANVMGGDDDWDPTAYTEQASAPVNVVIDNNVITWDNNDYVLCWAICKDGKVIDFTIEPTYTISDANAVYSVRAANEMGGLGEASIAADPTAIGTILDAQEVVETSIYTLSGVKVSAMNEGVYIVRTTYANGSVVVKKVQVK